MGNGNTRLAFNFSAPLASPNPSWGTGTALPWRAKPQRAGLLTPHGEREPPSMSVLAARQASS